MASASPSHCVDEGSSTESDDDIIRVDCTNIGRVNILERGVNLSPGSFKALSSINDYEAVKYFSELANVSYDHIRNRAKEIGFVVTSGGRRKKNGSVDTINRVGFHF